MINQIDFLTDPFIFNFLLFFILIAMAFAVSVYLEMKKFTTVLAIHSVLLILFGIMGLIQLSFVFFGILEMALLLKLGVNKNESD